MMAYRSDWPETGLSNPSVPVSEVPFLKSSNTEWGCSTHDKRSGITFRLCAVLNEFETGFYQIPSWDLRMEVFYQQNIPDPLNTIALQDFLKNSIHKLVCEFSTQPAYIYAKTVASEPLYIELIGMGFEAVEHRCLYKCRIGDLVVSTPSTVGSGVDYLSLAQLPSNLHPHYQEQILDVCKESFQTGSSRHFIDPYLTQRIAGVEYIFAIMRLNFEKVTPDGFLLAIDKNTGAVAGFSVIGKKPTLEEQTYTQLLSAVRSSYRGSGIYRGLSRFLAYTFPKDALLLNVTHIQNESIQRAYQDSGRTHLADTVIVRRFFGNICFSD